MTYNEDKTVVGEKVNELLDTFDKHGILKEFEKVDVHRVLTSTKHDTLLEAVLADFVDAVPLAGDVSNAIRVRDAIERHDELAIAMQTVDAIAGLVPIYGDIIDMITPTNTALYLFDKVPEAKEVAHILNGASKSVRNE